MHVRVRSVGVGRVGVTVFFFKKNRGTMRERRHNGVLGGKEVGNKKTFERERAPFAFALPIDTH